MTTPKLWIEQAGQGDPILFISGLGYASWCWAGVRQAFSPRYRAVTFDNRGTGRSEKPAGPYSIPMMADDAARVLDQCGIERAHVVGHSMGGYIAQTLALQHPQRLRALVLVGTGPGGSQATPVPAETQAAWASAADLSPQEYARRTMPLSFAPGWTDRHPDEFEQFLHQRLEFPTPSANWRAQFDACVEYFERGVEVEKIRAPTLVIHGRQDRIVPHENGALIARRLPGARFVSLEGIGHLPYLEDPASFERLLREFLSQQ